MNIPALVARRTAIQLAVVQFAFVCTWTVYVVFLPGLLASAGIAKSWVPWILLLDQALFAVMDLALGVAADRVRRNLGRIGPWLLGTTAVSCVAFLVLPHVGGLPGASGWTLLCILVWVASSSVLRAPPWLLLAKYAAAPSMPFLSALNLTGLALGAAIAPYLTLLLKGLSPALPFAVTSAVLLLTTMALIRVERTTHPSDASAAPGSGGEALAGQRIDAPLIAFFIAMALAGLGFQLHGFVNAAPLYLRFADGGDLPWLLPIFWIGFSVAMFPASGLTARHGPLPVIATAAFVGCVGLAVANAATSLEFTIVGQLAAGSAWGAVSAASFTAASRFGHAGREGLMIGALWCALSLAAMLRFVCVIAGLTATASAALTWAPALLWALAGGLVLLACRPLARSAASSARATER